MKRIKIASLFIKNNYKKAIPSIITLTTFLLILDILLGIFFSTTGILNDSIVENSSVHFMEILNNGEMSDISKIKEFISKQDEISGNFYDTSHPVLVDCDSEAGAETYTMIGIPKSLLPELGLKADTDKFCFLPKTDEKYFKNMTSIEIDETLYPKGKKGDAQIEYVKFDISGFYEKIKWDLFPENLIIVDDATAIEIAERSNKDGSILSDRIIAYVSDSAAMSKVEGKLKAEFPNIDVKYSLKYTGQLSEFAKVFLAIGGIIILVLTVFCIINIKESVRQILNVRKRDIGLLALFGVDNSNIFYIFMIEFFLYGLVAFVLAYVTMGGLFFAIYKVCQLDLFGPFYLIYLIADLGIAVLMFIVISAIQLRNIMKKIDDAKIFKEILK